MITTYLSPVSDTGGASTTTNLILWRISAFALKIICHNQQYMTERKYHPIHVELSYAAKYAKNLQINNGSLQNKISTQTSRERHGVFKSQVLRLVLQQLVQTNIKGNTKDPLYTIGPLRRESTGDGRFPSQRASNAGKRFRAMTSSWAFNISVTS